MPHLPPHAQLVASPAVWMESAAVDQLAQVARRPGCVRAVGLPDLHPGRGIPIGAAFAFRGVIEPALVGGDAGCGVRLVGVPRPRRRGEALRRRLDQATRGDPLPDCAPVALLEAVWRAGPAGLLQVPGVPASLAALAEALPPDDGPPSGPRPPEVTPHFARQLGTAGGGNHFLEVAQVAAVSDPAAKSAGLVRGGAAVLAHSGSRGVGGVLGRAWAGQRLDSPGPQATYLGQLAGAVRFARANRLVLAWRALTALGCARPDRIGGTTDLVHNEVTPWQLEGEPVWLHRKGAAPAEAGQLTVVLGSRGTPSVVMRGAGAAGCLCSVAHGAGRRMGRGEAVAKLKARYKRSELSHTALGGEVLCDDPALLYAEHPRAYKPVGPVVDSLVEQGLAEPVAELHPRFTVKR